MIRQPPTSTLFPNTTIFLSVGAEPPPPRIAPLPDTGRTDGDGARPDSRSDAFDHAEPQMPEPPPVSDRKSTRLNSSHQIISYAVFCLLNKYKTTRNKARLTS